MTTRYIRLNVVAWWLAEDTPLSRPSTNPPHQDNPRPALRIVAGSQASVASPGWSTRPSHQSTSWLLGSHVSASFRIPVSACLGTIHTVHPLGNWRRRTSVSKAGNIYPSSFGEILYARRSLVQYAHRECLFVLACRMRLRRQSPTFLAALPHHVSPPRETETDRSICNVACNNRQVGEEG